jgi:integrase
MRVLRLVLNYAEVMGMIEVSPTSILSKAKVWNKNNRRSRVIPSNQLKAWHDAVMSLSNEKAKLYFLTILYMGFRSEEALSIEWQNVNLKTKVITIEDTKNGSSHTLPIPSPLIPYFKDMNIQTGGSKWVFPSTDTTKRMWLPKKQITAVINASGVEFSSHDCRRTFATIAEAVNLPLTMIKRLMNHTTSNEVTGGYIVTEEETLREAINKIADYIQARVTQKNNVVTLKTAN